MPSVNAVVTPAGTPSLVRATTGSVTGSWGTGQNRTAGNLLVAVVTAGGTTASAAALSTPSGWTQQVVASNVATTANAWAAIYTKVAAGADAAPAFTATLTGTVAMTCTLIELAAASCQVPVDETGTYGSGGSASTVSSMTVTAGSTTDSPGDYGIAAFCQEAASATGGGWNPGSGWTNLTSDNATTSVLHTAIDVKPGIAQGTTVSETGAHFTTDTSAFGTAAMVCVSSQTYADDVWADDATTTVSAGGTSAPAAGTPEFWTAASWASFPVASNSAVAPTAFTVSDPAAPSEVIKVLNTSTGLVVRGADGTTPVTHAAGFTINNVISAGQLGRHRSARRRCVYLDDYGADPTGVTSSDTAFQSALADAQALLQPLSGSSATSGVVIVLGAGIYTFSVNVVATTDARIGLVGQGNAVTVIRTTGNTGTLVSMRGGSEPGTTSGAPVGGFTLYGWDAGNGLTGLAYSDRSYGILFDIYANGFSGTGSKGFYFNQAGSAGIEGVDAWGLTAKTCETGFWWDGNGSSTGSFDYSRWNIHVVACGTSLKLTNHANAWGSDITVHGNLGTAAFASSTLLAVGASGTDTSYINNCRLHIGVEADSGSTTITDFTIQGTAGTAGIWNCYGTISLLSVGGTWSAGSLGSGRFSFFGPVGGSPLFNGAASGIDATMRIDRAQAIAYQADSAQALSSSGTIHTATDGNFALIPVTETANVTGMILEAPLRSGTEVMIINRSAFTITFAASGTSHVADGATSAIPASAARSFVYDAGTSLWYRLA